MTVRAAAGVEVTVVENVVVVIYTCSPDGCCCFIRFVLVSFGSVKQATLLEVLLS